MVAGWKQNECTEEALAAIRKALGKGHVNEVEMASETGGTFAVRN
jgi:hypothetical protein